MSPMHLIRSVGEASARSGSSTTALVVLRFWFLVVMLMAYENGAVPPSPYIPLPPNGKLANEICQQASRGDISARVMPAKEENTSAGKDFYRD